MRRITRDNMFMQMAGVVAERGTCNRALVGAVLVDINTNNVVAIGYNGAPSGNPHCNEVSHKLMDNHCTNAVHAEENCFKKIVTPDWGDTIPVYNLYVTHYPCKMCMEGIRRLIAERRLKVKKIMYYHPYRKEDVDVSILNNLGKLGCTVVEYQGVNSHENT